MSKSAQDQDLIVPWEDNKQIQPQKNDNMPPKEDNVASNNSQPIAIAIISFIVLAVLSYVIVYYVVNQINEKKDTKQKEFDSNPSQHDLSFPDSIQVGIPHQSTLEMKNHAQKDDTKIRGWLLFLCQSLTIIAPLISIGQISLEWKQFTPYFDTLPGLRILIWIETIFGIGLIGFSIYAGTALWLVWENAVRTAKTFLITALVYNILIPFILLGISNLSSEINNSIAHQGVKNIFSVIIVFTIWYSYLSRSKRVRATYFNENESIEHNKIAQPIEVVNNRTETQKGKTMTNEKQKQVLIAIAAVVLGMLLYPPYHMPALNGSGMIGNGYDWLFSPPKYCSVDVSTLGIQWIGVSIIGCIAYFFFKDK